MIGVILATHGTMASSALELAEMLTGEKERVACIGFQAGDSLDDLLERFRAAIDALGTEQGILILTDLKGGSPCNAATLMQRTRENIRTVYGLSIPMLLQVFEGREETEDLDELADGALEVGALAMGKISFS